MGFNDRSHISFLRKSAALASFYLFKNEAKQPMAWCERVVLSWCSLFSTPVNRSVIPVRIGLVDWLGRLGVNDAEGMNPPGRAMTIVCIVVI